MEPQLPVGGGWHLQVPLLHHHPPQQPLVWHGLPAAPQPLQQAWTDGPSRTPQVSVPPELVVGDPELVVGLPQVLITGTHRLAGVPSTLDTGVQAWSAGQTWPLPQSEAQYASPPNCPQILPLPHSVVVTQGEQLAWPPPAPADALVGGETGPPPVPEEEDGAAHAAPAESPSSRAASAAPRSTLRRPTIPAWSSPTRPGASTNPTLGAALCLTETGRRLRPLLCGDDRRFFLKDRASRRETSWMQVRPHTKSHQTLPKLPNASKAGRHSRSTAKIGCYRARR